jgi:hypothetical protein
MRGKVWINHHCPNKECLMFIKEELEAHNLYIFEQAITDSDRIANILPFISNISNSSVSGLSPKHSPYGKNYGCKVWGMSVA